MFDYYINKSPCSIKRSDLDELAISVLSISVELAVKAVGSIVNLKNSKLESVSCKWTTSILLPIEIDSFLDDCIVSIKKLIQLDNSQK